MGSRNYAQVAPTPETIALNAYIFMYGGHSLVTPHTALKQLWWTDERIEAKITRPFVLSRLRGQEREFLDRPLAFGEGLTDDTYMDWILERAKRLFLILTEIGVPDQIFGCIDDSWTDDDLPLPLEDIPNLDLAFENDDTLNMKFYNTQFTYLLRQLTRQSHIDYGPKEHIPMEHVNTWPHAVTLQSYDRVHFPQRPDDVFMRRKFPLVDKDTGQSQSDQFMNDLQRAKAMNHEHIAPIWASYTSDGAGYTLSNFVPEHTLATFIEHRTPPQYMRLAAVERKVVLCEWMHCLADGLAFIHDRGMAHAAVRPTNIWIDRDNRIAFADVGCIRTLQRGKRSPKTEAYDYSAPECRPNKQHSQSIRPSSPSVSNATTFSRRRKSSTSSESTTLSTVADRNDDSRKNSSCTMSRTDSNMSPITPTTPEFCRSSTLNGVISQKMRNFSRSRPEEPPTPSTVSAVPSSFPHLSTTTSYQPLHGTAADIFSLGCVYLDIITFLTKGKLNGFIKFRSTPLSLPKPLKRTTASSAIPTITDTKGDTSFHASLALNPIKLTSWLDDLREDARRQSILIQASAGKSSKKKLPSAAADAHTITHILNSVPAFLELIEDMLSPIPTLRPSASQVRDSLRAILQGENEEGLAGIGRSLCCEDRVWDTGDGGLEGFAFGLEDRRGNAGSGASAERESRDLSSQNSRNTKNRAVEAEGENERGEANPAKDWKSKARSLNEVDVQRRSGNESRVSLATTGESRSRKMDEVSSIQSSSKGRMSSWKRAFSRVR